ncbi:hypothetical protein [Flavobacterium johnsoniae]|uniref:hypothetical protein n=1 Tax=Flavobacterium johnsoniae TaxID=986 RepID=UPI0032021C62
MTIADLIQNVINSSKERIKNPIVSAFICSFLIFNWRPISILLSYSLPIQCRIASINEEYCTKWALIIPIAVAFIYTLIVPVIMIGVDYCLMPIKKVRIANIYKNKDFTTDKKIKLAEKEYLLKNAESGNKERDELLEKIKVLENTNQQIKESHNNIVINLNNELSEANSLNERNVENFTKLKQDRDNLYTLYEGLKEEINETDNFFVYLTRLEKQDIEILIQMFDFPINYTMKNSVKHIIGSLEKLVKMKLLKHDDDDSLTLTELGTSFTTKLKAAKLL